MTCENYEILILDYIDRAGGREVYKSELVDNLLIELDIVEDVCERLGFNG